MDSKKRKRSVNDVGDSRMRGSSSSRQSGPYLPVGHPTGRVLSPPISLSPDSASESDRSAVNGNRCNGLTLAYASARGQSKIGGKKQVNGCHFGASTVDDAGNASDVSEDENEVTNDRETKYNVSKSGKAIVESLSKRESRPAPYFGYVDHSLDEDPDPLSPLSPPLRTPSFPAKMHALLFRTDLSSMIEWMPHGRSWRITDPVEFESKVIPLYFEHTTIASFHRQANGWGFCRMNKGRDRGSYYHECFLRGLPFLCKQMKRLGSAKKLLTGSKEPLLYEISAERPVPQGVEPDSLAAVMLSAINKCIIEGGPKAKMPVVHRAMEDFSFSKLSSESSGPGLTFKLGSQGVDGKGIFSGSDSTNKTNPVSNLSQGEKPVVVQQNTTSLESKPAAKPPNSIPLQANIMAQSNNVQNTSHNTNRLAPHFNPFPGLQAPHNVALLQQSFDPMMLSNMQAAQSIMPGQNLNLSALSQMFQQRGLAQDPRMNINAMGFNSSQLHQQMQLLSQQSSDTPQHTQLLQQQLSSSDVSAVSNLVNQLMQSHGFASSLPQTNLNSLVLSSNNSSHPTVGSTATMLNIAPQSMPSQNVPSQDIPNSNTCMFEKKYAQVTANPEQCAPPMVQQTNAHQPPVNQGQQFPLALPPGSQYSDAQIKELVIKAFAAGAKLGADKTLQNGNHPS